MHDRSSLRYLKLFARLWVGTPLRRNACDQPVTHNYLWKGRIQTKLLNGFALVGVGLAIFVCAAVPAKASIVMFSATAPGNDAGETNSASVTFNLSGPDLFVTLTNTATYKPNDPPDILTAVAFSVVGDPTFTPVSALVAPGSQVVENGSTVSDPGGAAGASWSYDSSLSGPSKANEGIGSSGYWGFGSNNVFPGSAVPGDSPTPPDGVGGGLTTAVDDGSKYNGGLKGRPFIQDSAVFTLSGLPVNFTLSEISNVSFGYGTMPEQVIAVVPEPGSIAIVLAGISFFGLRVRKRH